LGVGDAMVVGVGRLGSALDCWGGAVSRGYRDIMEEMFHYYWLLPPRSRQTERERSEVLRANLPG
jgi:hypothetical protein